MVTDAYRRWVRRVWAALERRTRRTVFYVDQCHIAGYCPSCGYGTLNVRFLDDRDEPGMSISSPDRGQGFCSNGCTERMVNEALFNDALYG
jgi:hypothetical protein